MLKNRLSAKERGPLYSLTENKYKFSSLNYPKDIENLSHSILFNILIQNYSKDVKTNKVQRLTETTGELLKGRTSRLTSNNALGLNRKTSVSNMAISLYVPDSLVFDNSQQYQTPSLISELGIAGTAAASATSVAEITSASGAIGSMMGAILGQAGLDTLKTTFGRSKFGRELTNSVVGELANRSLSRAKIGTQLAGFAINPVIEVLYTAPTLRQFNFDFVFAPRSSQEADDVWEIIYNFRRHSAPELDFKGLLFIPPSEFEISFLRRTTSGFVENTNIPRIATCVLRDVQVDYASSGSFVTYSDGMPVQIRMRLQFQELNMITREAIDEGY